MFSAPSSSRTELLCLWPHPVCLYLNLDSYTSIPFVEISNLVSKQLLWILVICSSKFQNRRRSHEYVICSQLFRSISANLDLWWAEYDIHFTYITLKHFSETGEEAMNNRRYPHWFLCSDITPGRFGGPYVLLEMKPMVAICKTNTPPTVLLLCSSY